MACKSTYVPKAHYPIPDSFSVHIKATVHNGTTTAVIKSLYLHLSNNFFTYIRPAYLAIELSSSCVKDTWSHTSTSSFSVDSELLRYLPGHADALQILLYGVYLVLSWSSRLSFCTTYIPVQSIRRTCPSHLSLLSFMMRFIFGRPAI